MSRGDGLWDRADRLCPDCSGPVAQRLQTRRDDIGATQRGVDLIRVHLSLLTHQLGNRLIHRLGYGLGKGFSELLDGTVL